MYKNVSVWLHVQLELFFQCWVSDWSIRSIATDCEKRKPEVFIWKVEYLGWGTGKHHTAKNCNQITATNTDWNWAKSNNMIKESQHTHFKPYLKSPKTNPRTKKICTFLEGDVPVMSTVTTKRTDTTDVKSHAKKMLDRLSSQPVEYFQI